MPRKTERFSIRSYQDGDEAILAPLFNSYTARFFGPVRETPKSWREHFRRHNWNAPSFEDADCCRIAESNGRVLGYAIADYEPMWVDAGAMVQELCVIDEEGAEEVMDALIGDAEKRTIERGKTFLILQLSPQDGFVSRAAAELGYIERADNGSVFMVAVTDLTGCLSELEPLLTSRLCDGPFSNWHGSIKIASGEQSAGLLLGDGKLAIASAPARPTVAVTIHPEWLPMLLFGRERIGELYSQDAASLKAADMAQALRLLDTLFPLMPTYLPRAQWW